MKKVREKSTTPKPPHPADKPGHGKPRGVAGAKSRHKERETGDVSGSAALSNQKKPTGAKTVTHRDLYAAIAKEKTAEYYLGIWNRVLGPAAEENKAICHAIISKKLAAMEQRLKSGDKYVNVPEEASYVAHAPRLGQIEKKDPLTRYIQLVMLEELEKLRKTKNLRFEYITTPK